MISRKLFGPPGTGKTTRLLRYVKTFLKLGTPIDKIGYFAFTTKAANEAVNRMLDYHTAFQKKDLKHFKTLHSLAFNQLGMKKTQVMQDEHYEDIGRQLGIEVTIYKGGEENTGFINSDSEYFNLINAARIKNISIEDEYNTDMYSQDMDKRLLKIISDEVNNYKQSYGLIDFTDMIEKFIVSGLCPKYDVAFIDEAQDLSPIQWKMFNIIKENSKYVILAGDDDQAIYGWAGADVKKFQQEVSKKDIILPQSYRVPQSVQSLADKILDLIPISRRVQKNWKARKEQGTVNYVYSLEDVPIDEGKWLVLARYNDKLNRLKPFLKERGIYFEYKDRKSYKVTLFRTILNYLRWQKGDELSLAEVKDIFEYTGTDTELTEERMYNLTEFGFIKDTPWYDVFQSDYEECLYIREMLSNGEELRKDPRVKLSTIHSAKGGEADNVILFTDIPHRTWKAYEKEPDDDTRVFYVGLTRAKQKLHIIQPTTNKYFMV